MTVSLKTPSIQAVEAPAGVSVGLDWNGGTYFPGYTDQGHCDCKVNVTVAGNKVRAGARLSVTGMVNGVAQTIRLRTTGSAVIPSARRPSFALEGCLEVAEKLVVGTKRDHRG
jgi:hypothetical protein